MTNHNNFLSKNLYKIFLSVVKYIPITLLLIKITSTILNLLSIHLIVLTYIGGTSVIFLILLYLISFVFNYCYLYKMPLYYMTAMDLFIIISTPLLSAINIYRIIFITFGIFMVGYIAYAYINRNNKTDYIKDLCIKYCNY